MAQSTSSRMISCVCYSFPLYAPEAQFQVILSDELVSHPSFEEHQLRVTEPEICDANVKQYSGYLDISTDKHLFFWYAFLSFLRIQRHLA